MRIFELKESKPRGNFDFPVEAYLVDKKHPRYHMPTHWHEEFEMIRVLSGAFHYSIGQERGIAGPGTLLFVGSGVFHGGMAAESVYQCVVFDSLLLDKSESSASGKTLAAFHQGDLGVRCRLPDDPALARLFDQLFPVLTQKPRGFELQAQGLLYQFFGLVLQRHYYEHNEAGEGKRWVSQLKVALSLIEQEYASPLTLADLAQAAGMSQKYFCHFFKQMTRYSPIEYLNRHRIEVACYRLMANPHSVTELAYECGFNDLSYFIRVFKRIVGVTPKKYAIMHRGGEKVGVFNGDRPGPLL